MELAIRDMRDPFTQALAFLFSNEKDTAALRRKLREKLIPLVTQVAVKIGGIDSEKAVKDRALAVFTGTISLHLAHTSVGKQGDLIREWAEAINSSDLSLLFRKGYTLINELVVIAESEVSFGDWLANIKSRGLTTGWMTKVEHLEWHATERDQTGLWIGYRGLGRLFEIKQHFEYSLWLVRQARAEQIVIDNRTNFIDPETIVNRVIVNVLLSGTVSLAMDYKRAAEMINRAHGNKRWFAEAKKRYRRFLATVPEEFKASLTIKGGNLRRYQFLFWEKVEGWPKKAQTRYESISVLCMDTAIPSPGLEDEIASADKEPLRKERIE